MQQQQQNRDDEFYASPYVLARHYIEGERSESALGPNGGLTSWTNSPVGPVAGAILAVFIVLMLGIYCLRHQAANRAQQNAAAALAAGDCVSAGLIVCGGVSGGEGGVDGDSSKQSACSRNHSVSLEFQRLINSCTFSLMSSVSHNFTF